MNLYYFSIYFRYNSNDFKGAGAHPPDIRAVFWAHVYPRVMRSRKPVRTMVESALLTALREPILTKIARLNGFPFFIYFIRWEMIFAADNGLSNPWALRGDRII